MHSNFFLFLLEDITELGILWKVGPGKQNLGEKINQKVKIIHLPLSK